jgi:hypothetical protein
MLMSSHDHLNYQVADYKARNAEKLIVENTKLNEELKRLKEEENKIYWREHYKDKYKSHAVG